VPRLKQAVPLVVSGGTMLPPGSRERFETRLGEAITDVDGSEIVARYNAMVDDMYLAGDEFNIALRRFKEQ
jgi:hypothetical protein